MIKTPSFFRRHAYFTFLVMGVGAISACAPLTYAESDVQLSGVLPSTPPTLETVILPVRIALIPTISPFAQTLRPGDQDEEVLNVQRFLNQHGFVLAMTGPGSPGNETTYFGPLTRAALIRYQEAYGAYILAPAGAEKGTGIFGPLSMAHANSLLQHRFVNLFPAPTPALELPETPPSSQLASPAGIPAP